MLRRRRRFALLLSTFVPLVLAVTIICAPAKAYTRVVTQFGFGRGSDAGSLELPGGIAFNADHSRFFVADTSNDRVSEFTAEGEFVRAFGWGVRDGSNELQVCTESTGCQAGQFGRQAGELDEPSAVAVAPDGTVWVLNRARFDGRIEGFKPAGQGVTYTGALPAGYGRTGAGQTSFSYPLPYSNDIAVDSSGQVYVGDDAEAGPRIVRFKPKGGAATAVALPGVSSVGAFTLASGGRFWATDGSVVVLVGPKGEEARSFVAPEGADALAVRPGSEDLLAEFAEFSDEESRLAEFDEGGSRLSTISTDVHNPDAGRPSPYGFALDPALQLPESEPGAILVVDRFGARISVLAEATPGPAVIERQAVEAVGTEGASLSAVVNPNGNDTHVHFEYGTSAAYGSVTPAAPGLDLGEGFAGVSAARHLDGLQPDTTYHYAVVATSSVGTEVGPDATFTTFARAVPFSLPDGRSYELTSTEKGLASIGGVFAAPAGDGVLLGGSSRALPSASSGGLGSVYSDFRTSDSWRTEFATVPAEESDHATVMVSPDLKQTVGISEAPLAPGAPAGRNLYLRDNATGGETLITPSKPPGEEIEAEPYGASADFRHIFLRSATPLTPDTPESASRTLYEYSGGTLEGVGILPGQGAPGAGEIAGTSAPYAVSEDGSKVYFVTEPAPGTAPQLFVRIDGSRTIEVSGAAAGSEDGEAAGQAATFLGATPDGSVAYFTSSARLTADAYTGSESGEPKDLAPNLYRYELATGHLVDLTVDEADVERGAAVTGSVVVAAGGTSAYLVAEGVLAPGGTASLPNLYRWTQGRGISFVATLRSTDPLAGAGPASSAARVSTDGSVLAFNSTSPLDPAYPNAEGTLNFEEHQLKEIYRYSSDEGRVVCVSCSRFGTGEPVNTEINGRPGLSAGYGGNVLSADGRRLFFTAPVALVSEDTNGANDVYEWEDGGAHLISSGTGSGAGLVDASVSGDDVFFTTGERSVAADQDDYGDVYDARVGGGLPTASVASPCRGEECRTAAEAAPPAAVLGSRSLNGPSSRTRHRHKKRKRHRGRHHRRGKGHGHAHGRSHGNRAAGGRR